MYASADAMHGFAEAIADIDMTPAHACCPDWRQARHDIGGEAASPELINQALQHALWCAVQRAAQAVRLCFALRVCCVTLCSDRGIVRRSFAQIHANID